jgi:4-amino-4-deoxy-L-arabinose transferase-like glycosyltransferase
MSTQHTERQNRRAAPDRRGARPSRPPRPPTALLFLLGATLLLGSGWALFLPPFQAPDETAHVAYVQSLAERGDLPGDATRPLRSTEQELASGAANSDQTAQQLLVKPEWSPRQHEAWLRQGQALSSAARVDGGGPNPASSNPPLYYLWLLGPYEAASGGDFFARLSAMRLASVPLLLITVTATWLLAGTVFGPRRPQQLAAASLPALLPMVTFVSSSVTPDALLYALSGLVLWMGARVLVRKADIRDVVALCILAGLAVLTKATAYALLPAVAVAVVGGACRGRQARRVGLAAVVAVAAFVLVVAPWYVVARATDRPATGQLVGAGPASNVDVRELGSYVWQYYLPRLPFQTRYAPLGEYPQSYETWFKRAVGAFGFLEIRWPPAIYAALLAAWLALILGAMVTLVRRRRTIDLLLLAFFAIAVISLLAGLHWSEYRIAESSGALFSQGRYLFPLLPLAGLVASAALTSLPLRWRPPALGALVGGLVVLQAFGIALVAVRFYA